MQIILYLDNQEIKINRTLEIIFCDYKFVISNINNLKGFIYNNIKYSLDKWYLDLDSREIKLYYRNILYWEA